MPWRMLFEQVEEFNPDVDGGGLQHDDCVDVVCAMPQLILKGRLSEPPKAQVDHRTVEERLRAGDTFDELGLPILHGIPLERLDAGELLDIIASKPYEGTNERTQA